uniref:Cirhin n=1 Tax=Callorhinchus milii TaxID=7868 RepID=V9KJ65_CALMI|eukprot:gi/632978824/ref/XP_007906130.1/ PREDICTED: cirhin [Callorhinchus milii]
MAELLVHRVRFFDYLPAGLRCLSYNSCSGRLAAARLSGAVEIFSFNNNFFQEKVIPGDDRKSIEAMCWVGWNRLFTVGLTGEIMEIDLQRLCPKYSLDAFGGPVWCMSCNPEETHLAIGCEDGSVKLFEIIPEKLQYARNLDRQKGRVLSLAWHKAGSLIATGSLNVICVFDVKSGHCVQRMDVDRRISSQRNRECVVWSVLFLSDSIVSADSTGKVQLWDWQTGTLLNTHHVTKCDALSLAVNPAEDSIAVGTSEGTVIQFQLLETKSGGGDVQWVRTKTFKYHTHDVRGLVHTKSALVSGGLDAQLVLRPLMDKVETKSYEAALRKVIFPHRSLVCCSREAKLLLFQFPSQLELWSLDHSPLTGAGMAPTDSKPDKVLQLKKKGSDHIHCCCLSPCGEWISYATASRVCVYRVQYQDGSVTVTRVAGTPKQLRGVQCLVFSADSTRLFAGSERSAVHVVDVTGSRCTELHIFTPKSGCQESISLLAVSADGEWVAAASHGGEINIYNLMQLMQHCIVPVYNQPPTAMAIHPQTNNLLTVHTDHQIFEFSLREKRFTDWSRQLQQQGLHPQWVERDTPVTHITFNPDVPTQFMLHDMYMFCIIDQTLRLPTAKCHLYNQAALRGLSANARRSQAHAFKICKKFQPLLHVEMLSEDSLVVIERPLMDINTHLPAPVKQKKFAT